MNELPFETVIREFMWKIEKEYNKMSQIIDMSKPVDKKQAYIEWRYSLERLASVCSSSISDNLSFRKLLNKN